jgi:hypothetical protein
LSAKVRVFGIGVGAASCNSQTGHGEMAIIFLSA